MPSQSSWAGQGHPRRAYGSRVRATESLPHACFAQDQSRRGGRFVCSLVDPTFLTEVLLSAEGPEDHWPAHYENALRHLVGALRYDEPPVVTAAPGLPGAVARPAAAAAATTATATAVALAPEIAAASAAAAASGALVTAVPVARESTAPPSYTTPSATGTTTAVAAAVTEAIHAAEEPAILSV